MYAEFTTLTQCNSTIRHPMRYHFKKSKQNYYSHVGYFNINSFHLKHLNITKTQVFKQTIL